MSNKTVCKSLAEDVIAAYLENADFRLDSSKFTDDLPLLRTFLKNVARARVQYPDRVEKLEELLRREASLVSLSDQENNLAHLLKPDALSKATDEQLLDYFEMLGDLATALFAIHRTVFEEAQQAYDEATAI